VTARASCVVDLSGAGPGCPDTAHTTNHGTTEAALRRPHATGILSDSMLSVASLSKRYGSQVVFDNVSWAVPDGARVGLTGPNGAGKSTLLKIIAGAIEPDDGQVAVPKGTLIGYLPQHIIGIGGVTVLDHALAAFSELHELEKRRETLEHQLATVDPSSDGYAAILDRYTAVCEEWEHRARYDIESETETVLHGLGFTGADMDRDCSELSGGWQMRVALAQLLLRRPDVLLLDEPTNYLDLEARTWLEEFLAAYPGTVILVAHDRYFLDVAVDRIAEVLHGRITDYEMNYTRYLAERETRMELAHAAYENQKVEIERIESFISRFRYQASKAALVQSRIKQLERIERLPPPEGHDRELRIRLPEAERSGRIVLEGKGLTKRYGDHVVYDHADLLIERGQRVAIVGPNGAGKTTLLKMLAELIPLDGGERKLGHNVRMGYFAQDHAEMLTTTRTLLDEMLSVATAETAPHVRALLGAFLFSGDAVEKRVGVLSGGERSRLALAKILLEPRNCLLLDEPTNHLDLTAKEVLLAALVAYGGTIVIVAHDRYILDKLPTHVIEVGTGKTVLYHGNYEDYLQQKARNEAMAAAAAARNQKRR
jgi:ATP-binding cassette subfamily F protein 3